jgi:hypothetical protein
MTTTEPTTTEPIVYATSEYPAWAVQPLTEKIERANRRVARLGLGSPFSLEIVREFTKTRKTGRTTWTEPWVEIRITGAPASLPGWVFAATVDWSLGAAIVNVSPTYQGTLPIPTDSACDHCGTSRSRKDTYLVVGPDGAVKQVGNSCLANYTGIHVGWVSLAESLGEADEDDYFPTSSVDLPTAYVLGWAVRLISALGYTSAQAERDSDFRLMSTRTAFNLATGPIPKDRFDRRRYDEIWEALEQARTLSIAEADAEVEAILEWARSQQGSQSEYISNLAVIAGADSIGPRHIGYALSMPAAFTRAKQSEAERAARKAARDAERATAAPVPTGRVQIEGEVRTIKAVDSMYGLTYKMRVVSDAGWAVWGTIPSAISQVEIGDRVSLVATVEASADDKTFGFYKRPAKATIAAKAAPVA